MSKTSIEWTQLSWNPVTGCTKVSPGCENCYAERMALRLKAMGQPNYTNGFKLTIHDKMAEMPLSLRRPKSIFVNSMGDLFHENVPIVFIERIVDVIRRSWWHKFQVLTKRSKRLIEINKYIDWPDNLWVGVSVENKDYLWRIDHLRKLNTRNKFISFEPLLGSLETADINGINWVIVGGESGPKARPIDERWVMHIKDLCISLEIPFFFKQWGGVNKKRSGRLLGGRTWDGLPRIIQYPLI